MLTSMEELEVLTQRMRVAESAGEAEALKEYGIVKSSFSEEADVCDALIKSSDCLGHDAMIEILRSLPSSVVVYKDFSESPYLPLALDKCLKSDSSASLVLQILHKAEKSQEGGLADSCIPLVTAFACDKIGSQSSLSLSEASASLMEALMAKSEGEALKQILQTFMLVMQKVKNDSTLLLRYCTVLSKLLNRGDHFFAAIVECGGVAQILSLCQTDDILLQMTTLDLLHGFAGTRSGLQYLVENGVLDWLLGVASGSESGEC